MAGSRTPSTLTELDTTTGAVLSTNTDSRIGWPIDTDVDNLERIYVATQTDGVVSFDLQTGAHLRTYGSAQYDGVAVLPGGVLWATDGVLPEIHVFDIDTAAQTGSITLDNGQNGVAVMLYIAATNTVLTLATNGYVYERTTAGAFVRRIGNGAGTSYGIMRNEAGNVFITLYYNNVVQEWTADGSVLVDTHALGGDSCAPIGIIEQIGMLFAVVV